MNFLRNPKNRRAIQLKRMVAAILCSAPFALVVRVLTRGLVPSHGMRIDTRSPEVSDSTRAQLFWGIYEGAEVRLARSHLRPTPCIVDLGCSLGVLASVAASGMAPETKLIGVEANHALIGLAVSNIRRNAPHISANIIHGAVDYSHRPGTVVAFQRARAHTGSALSDDVMCEPGFSAPALNLSEILAAEQIGEFTLLSDIEGAEAGLLKMDAESLAQCSQMLIEIHETSFDGVALSQDYLLEQALSLGFEVTASYGSVYVLDRST